MLNMDHIPHPLRNLVEREIASDEQVVWMEMPSPRFFPPSAVVAILFGIPWTIFIAFFFFSVLTSGALGASGASIIFAMAGVPFLLIGLLMLSAPYWARKAALRTVYVITDRRAIIVEGMWSTTIRSYPPEKLHNVFRRERANNLGDVIIAHNAWRDSDGDRRMEELGFRNIRNPQGVEAMLNQLAEKSARD